ncbi:MAG: hypothetical protein V5A23_03235 [Halobacteriales archaeon]
MLSVLTEAPRIGGMQRQAVEAKERIADQEAAREEAIDELAASDYDELDLIAGPVPGL